jgi:hypothetical protein
MLISLTLSSSACGLFHLFEPNPPEGCEPGLVVEEKCGLCLGGFTELECSSDGQWVTIVECHSNPYDLDNDGYASPECLVERGSCCGEQTDCDDEHPERWPGHADIDEDGFDDIRCGGNDCDDDDPTIFWLNADRDNDGHHDVACGGDDCDDSHDQRWIGHADLDGDGHTDLLCCSDETSLCDDCNDDDPLRWSGHADLDGDGFDDQACGGDDCNDDDPRRWIGRADLDGDGRIDEACGGDDCDDSNPHRWIGQADLDGDGHDDDRCGGDDCDDDCPDCRVGGVHSCGSGRDHDCDGVVDDVFGCGACPPASLGDHVGPIDTGDSRAVFVVGDMAYVASQEGLFAVHHTPDAPELTTIVDWVDTSDSHDLFVERDHAFVVGDSGLWVVDVATSARMARVAGPLDTGDSRGVFIAGARASVASYSGFHVVDVRVPTTPVLIASLEDELIRDSRDVWSSPLRAIVVGRGPSGTLGLYTVRLDAVDQAHLEIAGELELNGATRISQNPDMAFVSYSDAFAAISAAELGSPSLVRSVEAQEPLGLFTVGLLQLGAVLLVAEAGRVSLYDVTRPQGSITPIYHHPLDEGRARAQGVFVSGGWAYVATDQGLYILELLCS